MKQKSPKPLLNDNTRGLWTKKKAGQSLLQHRIPGGGKWTKVNRSQKKISENPNKNTKKARTGPTNVKTTQKGQIMTLIHKSNRWVSCYATPESRLPRSCWWHQPKHRPCQCPGDSQAKLVRDQCSSDSQARLVRDLFSKERNFLVASLSLMKLFCYIYFPSLISKTGIGWYSLREIKTYYWGPTPVRINPGKYR